MITVFVHWCHVLPVLTIFNWFSTVHPSARVLCYTSANEYVCPSVLRQMAEGLWPTMNSQHDANWSGSC